MKKVIALVVLLLSTPLMGQNGIIRGTVYEEETSEALFYANAQILSCLLYTSDAADE